MGTEPVLKPRDFLGLLLALADDQLPFQCLFQSTVILFAFIVGGSVLLNAGNKLPDKLEPVTISAIPKMPTFLTSRICSMVPRLLGCFPPSFPLFLPGAL